jgi:nucleoid DNA-binding protein
MNTKATIEDLKTALSEGGKVIIKGFGTFYYADKPARVGKNPRTGEPVSVPAKRVLKFKAAPSTSTAL